MTTDGGKECQLLYDKRVGKVLSGGEDVKVKGDLEEALREELLSEEAIQSYTRMEEINKRSDVSYDIGGFFKIDGVLYYITDDITDEVAYNLGGLPFQGVGVCSVYYSLKNNDSEFHFAWESAFDFLLHPRFHKELRELLKKGDLLQKSRIRMLYGFLDVLQNQQKRQSWGQDPEIYNFHTLFAILQLITRDASKARKLTQNCVSTISFQGVINYLSILV